MKVAEFGAMLNKALNSKSLYVQGAFGAPGTDGNKIRYTHNLPYNNRRKDLINAIDEDTFMWDCVCLIKGILWGWCGDSTRIYGGAVYGSNGVPDFGTEQMLKYCTNVSEDFTRMKFGEVLWLKGHAGVYIGKADDGIDYAIECTPAWKNCVQITGIANTGTSKRFPNRKWTKHGILQFIEY